MRFAPNKTIDRVSYQKAELALEPPELAGLLRKLAERKFKPGRVVISSDGGKLSIEGDKDAVLWADGVVKKLNEK